MANPPIIRTSISDGQREAIVQYVKSAQHVLHAATNMRKTYEDLDKAYMRDLDFTEDTIMARLANRNGDPTKFQNIITPIIMPQVETALGYFAELFLSGYPIFGVVSSPETSAAATMMEAVIAENSVTAGWARQLLMMFRDGLKYNFHGVECSWATDRVPSVVNDPEQVNSARPDTILWKGNKLRRMDPYNTFFDTRVAVADVSKIGEYVGYNEIMSRVAFKAYLNELTFEIAPLLIEQALASGNGDVGIASGDTAYSYYVPKINSEVLPNNKKGAFDWMSYFGATNYSKSVNKTWSNSYLVTTTYARIVPSDFDLRVPNRQHPQIWKFIVVNGKVAIYAERQSNAHNLLPIFLGRPMEDGLENQTRGFADNVRPMQEVSTAMWNAVVHSKQRSLSDRLLYDPSKIREKDINSPNPSAKIPVRNMAMGKSPQDSVYVLPFRDEQSAGILAVAGLISEFSDRINGQNPSKRGQFVKGNRTRSEFEDTMGNGNSRNKLMGIVIESQIMTPLKEAMKMNILQYQPDAKVTVPYTGKEVTIDIGTLRKTAVKFKISDGILPSDKIMAGDEWMGSLNVIGSSPTIGQGYNIAPMFSYLMEQRGVDLKPFQKSPEQMQYEQAMAAWSEAARYAADKGVQFTTPQPTPPPQQNAQSQTQTPANIGAESTQG